MNNQRRFHRPRSAWIDWDEVELLEAQVLPRGDLVLKYTMVDHWPAGWDRAGQPTGPNGPQAPLVVVVVEESSE